MNRFGNLVRYRLDSSVVVPNQNFADPTTLLGSEDPVTEYIKLLVIQILRLKPKLTEDRGINLVFSKLAMLADQNIIEPVPYLNCPKEQELAWVNSALVENIEELIVNV